MASSPQNSPIQYFLLIPFTNFFKKNIPTKERSISMKKTNVRIEKWRIFLHKSFDKLLPSMGSKSTPLILINFFLILFIIKNSKKKGS